MATYISSKANRFYVALESLYGQTPAISASNRIPALKLAAQQQSDTHERKDKTGSRTFAGSPPGGRKRTNYELRTYLTSWNKISGAPAYGPLFQGALGAEPRSWAGGTAASMSPTGQLHFGGPHALIAGQAVNHAGEIRFATAIVDESTVQLQAPFVTAPEAGAPLGATVTYMPATEMPSVSIFDYWTPASAVQRLLNGSVVDRMEILVNGDYHEVHFSGPSKDVLDSASFTAGQSALDSYPAEPELGAFDYSIVPGNLGQAWIGTEASRFCTITKASLVVKNGVDTRAQEFGGCAPRSFALVQGTVTTAFYPFTRDDAASQALYQA